MLFRIGLGLLALALAGCQGMYLHDADRAAAAATAKKSVDSVDVGAIVKTEQDNLAKLLAEEQAAIEARSKLVVTLSLLDIGSSDDSLALHYRGALERMKLALGDTDMLRIRDQGACEKTKESARFNVPNLKAELEARGAENVPDCKSLGAMSPKPPAGLSAADAQDFADTSKRYGEQCELLAAECRVAKKEATELDAAREKLEETRKEAKQAQDALKKAADEYKAAVKENKERRETGAEAEKAVRAKAQKVVDAVNHLAAKSPSIANRVKGAALLDLLTAAASGKTDGDDPDLAASLETAKALPALVGAVENAKAAREIVPVSHLLIALNDLAIQADRDARLAALDEEEIGLLERKLEIRTTQAGLWRRYSDQLCNLAFLTAGKGHPERACAAIELPADLNASPLVCKIRFSDDPKENPQSIDNCVLARPWKALLRDDNLKPQARRALYEAAAAYLHVRLIAYATTVEEFKRVDVRYRRQLVNREAALNQWRNLVAVPTDELNGYYSGGIKPAELADLVVKALGFTAIAIGVAQ